MKAYRGARKTDGIITHPGGRDPNKPTTHAPFMLLWLNWLKQLTLNQWISGSSPDRSTQSRTIRCAVCPYGGMVYTVDSKPTALQHVGSNPTRGTERQLFTLTQKLFR